MGHTIDTASTPSDLADGAPSVTGSAATDAAVTGSAATAQPRGRGRHRAPGSGLATGILRRTRSNPSAPGATAEHPSRRALLKAAAAGAGAVAVTGGWTPVGRLSAAEATAAAPPNLPRGAYPYLQVFANWAGDVRTDRLWTIDAQSESQVVALANWAVDNGWKLRPIGFRHNWSPLAVANGTTDEKVLLVDTRSGLRGIATRDSRTVTVGAGASMDSLLSYLDLRGKGFAHIPAPGDITVGGALAIGAHGTVVAASGESMSSGHSFGSLSNLVTSLRAVVWDEATSRYVAREFSRSDPLIGALLVHVGRAFVTEVTMRIGPRQQLRCQSFVNVPITELLAAPGSAARTTSRYLDKSGRIEIIWFPFTTYPWFKVWTRVGGLFPPLGSIPALRPYAYTFADGLFGFLMANPDTLYKNPGNTKNYAKQQADGVQLGLGVTLSGDIYGSAANVQRYVRPSTMKVTANGYAILCKRADVQWVLNQFYLQYTAKLNEYAARWEFPVNGPVEIRVMGVDQPADCGVPGAVDPWLSPTRRRPDRPDLDTVVYLDLLTLPFTPNHAGFYAEFEQWLWQTFSTTRTAIRVEWSKGWAYTADGAYTSGDMISSKIPESLTVGQPAGTTFNDAVATLNRLDPNRIYSSPLLDQVLPSRR